MNPVKYIVTISLISSIGIIVVALTNYLVDPSSIYHEKTSKVDQFINALLSSEHGLVLQQGGGLNGREISSALAKHSTDTDCFVIGSSHIMQISSFRTNKSIKRYCPSLINLGVDGASLEDYLALSESVLANTSNVKTIVFGVDPWALNYYRDSAWVHYKNQYYSMINRLENEQYIPKENNYQLFFNLISRDYFIQSVKSLLSSNTKEIVYAPKFDTIVGIESSVKLPDGSIIYSHKSNNDISYTSISGLHDYKMNKKSIINQKSVEIFTKLMQYLKTRFNVIFVLTPYHNNVWKYPNQTIMTAMLSVEKKIHQIAKKLNIIVVGSYDPNKVGCKTDEFYDAMHAKDTCLSKLKRVRIQK
jgi:hypothetical protein